MPSNDLLITKLAAYGFGPNSLALFANYLSHRKHRVKEGSIFSEWQEMDLGVLQDPVLGSLLFSIFISDFIFAMKSSDACNFADDNTVYACDGDVESVARRLMGDIPRVDCFQQNRMIANPIKFQVLFFWLETAPRIPLGNWDQNNKCD